MCGSVTTGSDDGVIRQSSVANCLSGSLWHCGNGQLSTTGARRQPNTVGHILYHTNCASVTAQVCLALTKQ